MKRSQLIIVIEVIAVFLLSVTTVAMAFDVTVGSGPSVNGSWSGTNPVVWTPGGAGSVVAVSDIETRLSSGTQVKITSTGTDSITVNSPVAWSASVLSLISNGNININANLNGSGTAILSLGYGYSAIAAGNTASYNIASGVKVNLPSGNNLLTRLGSDGTIYTYYVITSLGAQGSTTGTDLQGMRGNLAGNYALGADIIASPTTGWMSGGNWGFRPVGNNTTPFSGVFDGLGHTVSGLFMEAPVTNYMGLFGYTSAAAAIRNVGLLAGNIAHVNVTGGTYVGGLVGYNLGALGNVYSTAEVGSAFGYVGGLAGYNGGTISNSHATGAVNIFNDSNYSGGLAGYNSGAISNSYYAGSAGGSGSNIGGVAGFNSGTIGDCYSSGSVSGSGGGNQVGGLVGYNNGTGTISNSRSASNVNGNGTDIGGLVGNSGGTIGNSYATGTTGGSSNVGGLVGSNSGAIGSSYAAGNASGTNNIGGLAGNNSSGAINDSHATGSVSGGWEVGGLVGLSTSGTIANSYATGAASGSYDVGGLVGWMKTGGTVSGSFSTGSVTGDTSTNRNAPVGGLVGQSDSGTIDNSYSSSSVSGMDNYMGGLVGINGATATIIRSYSTGSVSFTSGSGWGIGGLVGENLGAIDKSYSIGSVSGYYYVGGLVGSNKGVVTNTYAAGSVSGNVNRVGGLVGENSGTGSVNATNFWDTSTSYLTGVGFNSGTFAAVGIDSAQARTQAGYSGWDFASTWWISDGNTRPILRSEWSATIRNTHQLQLMALSLLASYTLGNDITASDSANSTGVWNSKGFVPVGSNASRFNGSLDGRNHIITGLVINRTGVDDIGLFGVAGGASSISNLGLNGAVSASGNYVGMLAGETYGVVSNCYATGSVGGSAAYAGGVAGVARPGAWIQRSYAAASVAGSASVGGLTGYVDTGATVSNCYATGGVAASGSNAGGLVGENYGSISNSYASGTVSAIGNAGGLFGAGGGSVTASFWDVQTSGLGTSWGGTGKTTVQMKSLATFSGWNMDDAGGTGKIWRIYSGHTYPLLRGLLTPLTITADNVFKVYDGLAYTSPLSNATYSVAGADTSGHLFNSANPYSSATSAGTYAPDLWSDQHGYDISYVNAILTIAPVYGVTYNANFGTGSVPVDSNRYLNGATVNVLTNSGSLSRTGYSFTGWNSATDGSGSHYAADGSASFPMGAADVTLYAQWLGITSALSTSFTYGSAGTFTVTASGAPTAVLSHSGVLPTGIVFKDNGNGTAALYGTPNATGTFHITINATNSYGSVSQSFTLTVNAAGGSLSALDSSIAISPDRHLFGVVTLGSCGDIIPFTVKNRGSGAVTLTAASLGGPDAGQFAIDGDGCAGPLAAGGSCTVGVRFCPTSQGSKAGQLEIGHDGVTLTAFLYNHESLREEAGRRMPPVLSSLSIPTTITAGQPFTINWSLLGYDSDYLSRVAIFDCGLTPASSCGASFSSNVGDSGNLSATSSVSGSWSYGSIGSTQFNYSATLTAPASATNIVIRFYRKSVDDDAAGKGSLSLLVPGNAVPSGTSYFDSDGRRLLHGVQ